MNSNQTRQRGQAAYKALFGREKTLNADSTDLDQFTIDHLYADIWSRRTIPLRVRSMITLTLLTALGWDRELQMHLEGALRLGITREEILEIMIHVAHYAGWPAAHNGQCIAQEVFKKSSRKQLRRG